MRPLRIAAGLILMTTGLVAVGAGIIAPHHYATQFREHASEAPSRRFLLGTDELGRDRLSRVLYGTRVSVLCAPLAALVSMALAAAVGLSGGYFGGWIDEVAGALTDLFLSLPWLFALLTLRALLPLDISASESLAATSVFIAAVGWASGARVVRAQVIVVMSEGPALYARACGITARRLLLGHVLPLVRRVLAAQFWVVVPVFLLTEANLGVLGLGVAEPMPSWGNLIAELRDFERIPESPWLLVTPALLVLVVGSLHIFVSEHRSWE